MRFTRVDLPTLGRPTTATMGFGMMVPSFLAPRPQCGAPRAPAGGAVWVALSAAAHAPRPGSAAPPFD